MGVFDVIANVMTGGAYGITKATTQVAAGIAGQIAGAVAGNPTGGQPSGGANQPCAPAGAGNVPVAAQRPTECCTYSIEGDYLLDCKNGDVWLIDKGKQQLIPIKRQYSKLDGAAAALNLALIREQMVQQKVAQFGGLHHSVRGGIEKRFDSMIKVLDTEIGALHKP